MTCLVNEMGALVTCDTLVWPFWATAVNSWCISSPILPCWSNVEHSFQLACPPNGNHQNLSHCLEEISSTEPPNHHAMDKQQINFLSCLFVSEARFTVVQHLHCLVELSESACPSASPAHEPTAAAAAMIAGIYNETSFSSAVIRMPQLHSQILCSKFHGPKAGIIWLAPSEKSAVAWNRVMEYGHGHEGPVPKYQGFPREEQKTVRWTAAPSLLTVALHNHNPLS